RTPSVPFTGVSGSTFTASAFTSVSSMFLISQIAFRVASRGKAISLALTVVILDPIDCLLPSGSLRILHPESWDCDACCALNALRTGQEHAMAQTCTHLDQVVD